MDNVNKEKLCSELILSYSNKLVWIIRPKKEWSKRNGVYSLPYAGVGGKLEPKESFLNAALRECKEEINCSPKIISSSQTTFIDLISKTDKKVNITTSIKPLFVYRKIMKGKIIFVHVYLGNLTKLPKPSSETEALFLINKKLFLNRAFNKMKIKPTEIQIISRVDFPSKFFFYAVGSAEYFICLLNKT
ncbi:MAG: NUDIX hydrolase [Candidatus Micrarchaeota archaeon]|nr:NUDIX hydrolase [Candidatus Micrarchaeota archaeon]